MRRPFAALLFSLALIAPASASDAAPYITKDEIDLTHILPSPPQPGTPAEEHDIAAVLDVQAHASDADRARALVDGEETLDVVAAPVLGPKFANDTLPITEAFFARIHASYIPLFAGVKTYFHHPRPFALDPNVAAPEPMVRDICDAKRGDPGSPPVALCPYGVSYSYPSGHSTFATVICILLAEMVPEKRDALLLRSRQYGESRVLNGVHFPTDIEAGRITGSVIVALMMQDTRFRTDLAQAKAELRAALGLAP